MKILYKKYLSFINSCLTAIILAITMISCKITKKEFSTEYEEIRLMYGPPASVWQQEQEAPEQKEEGQKIDTLQSPKIDPTEVRCLYGIFPVEYQENIIKE